MQELSPWLYLFNDRTRPAVVSLMWQLSGIDQGRTFRHSLAVADVAARCAYVLDLPATLIEETIVTALLHDVGTIAGRPAAHEQSSLPVGRDGGLVTADLLGLVAVSGHLRACQGRWDGLGAPLGLAGHRIPLPARIIAVADAFDALTRDWPDRAGRSIPQALAALAGDSGSRFDPDVVSVVHSLFERPKVPVLQRLPSHSRFLSAPLRDLG